MSGALKNRRSLKGFLMIIFLSGCIVSKEKEMVGVNKEKDYCELKSFTAKTINGRTYINWVVNTNCSNFYFLLDRSFDGEHFTTICIKKGFSSPVREGLMYSYTDNVLKDVKPIYKLRAVPAAIGSDQQKILYADRRNLFTAFENAMVKVENDYGTVRK